MVIQMGGYTVEQVVSKGGFYVSRFLITKDSNQSIVSKKGLQISSIIQTRAQHVSSLRVFINTQYAKTSLISGPAYDALLNFVNNKRFSKGLFDVNTIMCKETSGITGNAEDMKVCNIYDLTVQKRINWRTWEYYKLGELGSC